MPMVASSVDGIGDSRSGGFVLGSAKDRVPECGVLTYPASMRSVLACVAFAAVLAIACRSEGTAPDPEPGLVEQEESPPSEHDLVPESKQTRASDEPALEPSSSAVVSDGTLDEVQEPGEGPSELPAEIAAEAPARDLAAELRAAIGVPSDCLVDFRRATPTTIRVSVGALVRPSGAIIQPTASGSGLSQQAQQCVARRVDAVVLRPLGGEVSQRISTVIEIPYVPPREVVGTKVGQPDPELRNVRQPLPPRREAAPSGRPIQEPTSRPIQEPSSRPIQEPSSRKPRGPKPRPIEGWDVDESAKEWR
jgi:hypothetical protein